MQWWNPQWEKLQNANKNCIATFAIHVETNRKYITYYTAIFKPMFPQKCFFLINGHGMKEQAAHWLPHSRIVKRDGDMIIKSL